MKDLADRWYLAILIAHYQATKDFTEPGAVALLNWYQEFCSTYGGNRNQPLDLSDKKLRLLPDLVKVPLSLGAPYIKLTGNPDLVDISALQDLPAITRLGTIEYALSKAASPAIFRFLFGIKKTILGSETTLRASLQSLAYVPIYLQLLPDLESLILMDTDELINFPNLSNFSCLSTIVISNLQYPRTPRAPLDLKELGELFSLKTLNIFSLYGTQITRNWSTHVPILEQLELSQTRISDFSELKKISNLRELSLNYCRIPGQWHEFGKFPSLEKLYLSNIWISDIEEFKKIPNLRELSLNYCHIPQQWHELGKFPFLEKLYLNGLDELESISIDTPNDTLEIMKVNDASQLQRITGINQLRGLKKFFISCTGRLEKIYEIKDVIHSLVELDVVTNDLDLIAFLKEIRARYALPGRLLLFTAIPREGLKSIGLFKHEFQEGVPIRIHLLRQNTVSLSESTADVEDFSNGLADPNNYRGPLMPWVESNNSVESNNIPRITSILPT